MKYSKKEEFINIITHIIGFLITLIVFIPILVDAYKENNKMKLLAFSIYFISIAIMFLSSSLYHSMTNRVLRTIFRAIDHSVIYLTIAGSYTPIMLLGIKSKFAIVIFIIVWILAIVGIVMNIIAFSLGKEEKIKKPSMAIYMIMGWISIFLIYEIYKSLGFGYLVYMITGGVLYTIGAIFYSNKKIPYNHAIWHIFIIFATFTMFYGNYLYLA